MQVVDLKEERVVRTIPAQYEPYGIALSPDGTKLYIANSLSNSVSIVDTSTGSAFFPKVGCWRAATPWQASFPSLLT